MPEESEAELSESPSLGCDEDEEEESGRTAGPCFAAPRMPGGLRGGGGGGGGAAAADFCSFALAPSAAACSNLPLSKMGREDSLLCRLAGSGLVRSCWDREWATACLLVSGWDAS